MQNEPVFRLIRSRRKTLGLQIASSREVIIRAPLKMPEREIRRFLDEKRGWIISHLEKAACREEQRTSLPPLSNEDLRSLANRARTSIPPRVNQRAQQLGVSYGRITIRNQRTRWGSCSSKGNLNFNCLLLLCPEHVLDYVVVHELCHRKEMNHSPRFRALVASVLPDWKTSEKWLKENGPAILGRMRSPFPPASS